MNIDKTNQKKKFCPKNNASNKEIRRKNMSSHIGRTYLNSCLKVPLDPCSNCPAPFFNRSKIYLERLSATPNTCNTVVQKQCNEMKGATKWPCGGVRSLAKLYDSIPDYTDLNHLSGEEFYTTLNSLRSTCRELEVTTNCYKPEDQCSISTTSLSLTPCIVQAERGRSKKNKKSKKKKSKSSIKCHELQSTNFAEHISPHDKSGIVEEIPEAKSCNSSFSMSSAKRLDKVVEILQKSPDDCKAEFKRPLTSLNPAESRPNTRCSSKEYANKSSKCSNQSVEKVPGRSTFTSTGLEGARKSLSCTDIHSLAESPELEELRKQNKMLDLLSFKCENSFFKNNKKLSNYFKQNSKLKSAEIPKIIVDSPTTKNSLIEHKSKGKYSKTEEYKMAFKIFDLDANVTGRNVKHSTPSPVHPVARPNLAATLRAESSKKKVQELKSNCTFQDTTTQFDWEVRKTPAWKTLSLNETHKQILQLRLATRKAEQALQQREYELNMELMRQRVKSAPLLLEGPTHWGPHVGKLTHSCQKDGRRHLCQRTKRRSNSSRGHSCRRRLFSTTSALEEENFDNPANTFRVEANPRTDMKHKKNELRKIYGSSTNITKSQSRSSNRSTNTSSTIKSQRRMKSKNVQKKEKKSLPADANCEAVVIDSGEELSSLDRAFL